MSVVRAATVEANTITTVTINITPPDGGGGQGETTTLQEQLDSKEPLINLTPFRMVAVNNNGGLVVSEATVTEGNYLQGLQGPIQQQIDDARIQETLLEADGKTSEDDETIRVYKVGTIQSAITLKDPTDTTVLHTFETSDESVLVASDKIIATQGIDVHGDLRQADFTGECVVATGPNQELVTTSFTTAQLAQLPTVMANVALLGASIEFDEATKTLTFGKFDTAEVINISNPAGTVPQTINIGSTLDTVNIAGELVTVNSTVQNVEDPFITLNKGGTATTGAGIRVESSGVVAAHFQLDADGNWEMKETDGTITTIRDEFAALDSNKLDKSGGTITGNLTIDGDAQAGSLLVSGAGVNATTVAIFDSSKKIQSSSVTPTALGYIGTLTSDAQTQIDGKQATITGAASTAVSSNFTSGNVVTVSDTGKLESFNVDKNKLTYLSNVTSDLQAQIDATAGSLVTDVSLSTPSTFNISDEDALRMYKLGTNNFSTWTNSGAAGPDNSVTYMYVNGTDLYISGSFTTINGVTMNRIAKYNTITGEWSTFGSGLGAAALFLEVYNGYLYAVGSFTSPGTRAVKWDLTNGGWSTVGTGVTSGGTVRSAYLDTTRDTLWATQGAGIYSFDLANAEARTAFTADGEGAIVYGVAVVGNYAYVCGTFSGVNGVTASRAARYNLDTSTWDAMPGSATVNSLPNTLYRYGTNLFYCGWMNGGGGVTSRGIVRYDTATDTWYPLGSGGISGTGDRTVNKIGVYDATTETFWVNGSFTSAVGTALTVQGIILYNLQSNTWSAIPEEASVGPSVQHMARINNDVFLGGTSSTTAGYFATYRDKAEVKSSDGSTVIHEFSADADPDISIVPHDFKVAGNTYLNVGGATQKVLTVDTEGKVAAAQSPSLTELGYVAGATGNLQTQIDSVYETPDVGIEEQVIDDSTAISNPNDFTLQTYTAAVTPGTTPVAWSSLGDGTDGTVWALAAIGTDLYVGGAFTTAGGESASGIAKYDTITMTWSSLGTGADATVYALAAIGTDLYVGGDFTTAGGESASRIAKCDTVTTTWSSLGAGVNDIVYALAAISTDLYVGGAFTTAGGGSANYIAKYATATTTWSSLGVGTNNIVWALAAIGTDLYVGGQLTTAGGGSASRIAKYATATTTWSSLGAGTNNTVYALAAIGTDLYVGGAFTTADGGSANYIAKYATATTTWSSLDDGMGATVYSLGVISTDLYIGGEFTTADGQSASRIARFGVSIPLTSSDGSTTLYEFKNPDESVLVVNKPTIFTGNVHFNDTDITTLQTDVGTLQTDVNNRVTPVSGGVTLGGVYIAYGTVSPGGTPTTVNYGITFSSAPVVTLGQNGEADWNGGVFAMLGEVTTTSFKVITRAYTNSVISGRAINWMAIGQV